jgi:hypothetical protein
MGGGTKTNQERERFAKKAMMYGSQIHHEQVINPHIQAMQAEEDSSCEKKQCLLY